MPSSPKRRRVDEPRKRSVEKMASIVRKIVQSDKAPAAIAVLVDKTVYLSGQLGIVPETGELAKGIKDQTHQALKNIGEVLKAAGTDYSKVVKTTVLLADIGDFATVNDIYKQYFTENYPARAAYQVAVLPKQGLVEIETIAVVGDVVNKL